MVKENRHKFNTGVVHSYSGDEEELQQLLAMDLFIGVNGCSMKTVQNCEIVKRIPLDRLMLETDCPCCFIRNNHAASEFVRT
jgi:TatD DNase family protein